MSNLSLDMLPHPGFGALSLTCDGETPEAWWVLCGGSWIAGWRRWTLDTEVTLGEIEEAVARDPDHDWRLEVHGPISGVVYQRQGCAQWLAVERLHGFA